MSIQRVKRHDPLNPNQRSAQMAKVRGKKNRSTEMRVAAYLIRRGVRGWTRHAADVLGRPDFYFVNERVALFVDGCFWHGCRYCCRNVPHSRRDFWSEKIESNRRRDRRIERLLRSQGYAVVRIWEHSLGTERWMTRLRSALQRAAEVSHLLR
jgi:DNA mismatch endonuclease (patch repair protein)